MADTKIGDATNVATLALADEVPIADADAATAIVSATMTQVKALVNTSPAFTGGAAAAASWPTLASGTLLTTAEAGAIERDANNFYLTTDAGNRGYVPAIHIIRADTIRTYTSNTSSQSVFNVPTNGRLTLELGTYRFRGLLAWTAMEAVGTSNRSLDMLGAGTAVIGSWLWQLRGIDNAALNSLSDLDAPVFSVAASAASMVTGVAASTLRCAVEGTFEVTTAGTIIPSTTMVAAAASVLSIGSFLEFWRVGSTSMTSVGQWD